MGNKIGFLFPGQGSQKLGMGLELLSSKLITSFKNKGIDIESILKDEKLLNDYAPYAIFFNSFVLAKKLEEKGVIPDTLIGFSLGEITSLSFSEVLDFDESLNLLIKRTNSMEKECKKLKGKMVSVLGVKGEEIEKLLEDSGVYIANLNSKTQTVVAGESKKIDEFKEKLKLESIKHVELNVNGAFHSPYMRKVGDELRDFLRNKELYKPKYKIMSNYMGDYHGEDKEEIINNIIKQVYSPVKFMDMVKNANLNGVDTFIEVGEGKTLSNLVKRILSDEKIKIYSVRNISDVGKIADVINRDLEK